MEPGPGCCDADEAACSEELDARGIQAPQRSTSLCTEDLPEASGDGHSALEPVPKDVRAFGLVGTESAEAECVPNDVRAFGLVGTESSEAECVPKDVRAFGLVRTESAEAEFPPTLRSPSSSSGSGKPSPGHDHSQTLSERYAEWQQASPKSSSAGEGIRHVDTRLLRGCTSMWFNADGQWEVDKDRLREKARDHQLRTACRPPRQGAQAGGRPQCADDESDGEKPRSVFDTTPAELGVYGAGITLYFDMLYAMGILFSALSLLTLPLLVLSFAGTTINDSMSTRYIALSDRLLAFGMVANMGSCPKEGCQGNPFERLAFPGSSQKLEDVAPMIALIEFLVIASYAGFALYFGRHWIPRALRVQDNAFVTAADYGVYVSGLPKRLEDHRSYEDQLRHHFSSLLHQLDGRNEIRQAIGEICLIRNWNGAMFQFERQGKLIKEFKNSIALESLARRAKQVKKADKMQAKITGLRLKIEYLEEKLREAREIEFHDRDVCGAFIMFRYESYKEAILELYQAHDTTFIQRAFQPTELRFHGKQIAVDQAEEPDVLLWENLDTEPWKRRVRKLAVKLASFCINVALLLLLILLRSSQDAELTVSGRSLFVFRGLWSNKPTCWSACDLRLAADHDCHDYRAVEAFDTLGSVNFTDGCWESDVCRNVNGSGWLYARTPELLDPQLKCLSFSQTVSSIRPFIKDVEVWACHEELVPLSTAAAGGVVADPDWHPQEACVHLSTWMVTSHDAVSESNAAVKGDVHINPEKDCGTDVERAVADHVHGLPGEPHLDQAVFCHCQQKASQELYVPRMRRGGLCGRFDRLTARGNIVTAISVLALMIINSVSWFISAYLNDFPRQLSKLQKAKDGLTNYYVTLVLNTGIVLLLVGMNLKGSEFSIGLFGNGAYAECTTSWFVNVGVQLFISVCVQGICILLTPVVIALLHPYWIRWFEGGCATQETMNDLYSLPEWELMVVLGETMSIITCVILYSGIMPMLNWFGVFFCFSAYWVNKWSLLRSRKPPAYDGGTIAFSLKFIVVASVAHSVFQLWVLGHTEIVPSQFSAVTRLATSIFGLSGEDAESFLKEYSVSTRGAHEGPEMFRMFLRARLVSSSRRACLGPVAVLLFVVSVFIVRFSFGIIRACLPESCRGRAFSCMSSLKSWCHFQVWLETTEETYTTESYEEAKIQNQDHLLFSYEMRANPRYKAVSRALRRRVAADGTRSESRGYSGWSSSLQSMEKSVTEYSHNIEGRAEQALGVVRHHLANAGVIEEGMDASVERGRRILQRAGGRRPQGPGTKRWSERWSVL